MIEVNLRGLVALTMKHHKLGMRLIYFSGTTSSVAVISAQNCTSRISYHLPKTAAKDLYENVDILITKYH